MLNLFTDTNISSSWVCSFYKGIATAKYSINLFHCGRWCMFSILNTMIYQYNSDTITHDISPWINTNIFLAITCLIWNILTHTFVISMTFAKKSHQTSFLSFVVCFFHPCFILLFIWLRASIFFKVYNQIQNDNGWYE